MTDNSTDHMTAEYILESDVKPQNASKISLCLTGLCNYEVSVYGVCVCVCVKV